RQVWQRVRHNAGERAAWGERQRRRQVVARVHERIRWWRSDFTHRASRQLVDQYDFLAVEELSVRNMVQNPALAKSIPDETWTLLARLLRSKGEWAGRAWVAVDPAYSSQECSDCGWRNPALTLADRTSPCARCGLVLDRDPSAVRNSLARG